MPFTPVVIFTHFSPGYDPPEVVNEYVKGVDVAPLNGKVALPDRTTLLPEQIDVDVPALMAVGETFTVMFTPLSSAVL